MPKRNLILFDDQAWAGLRPLTWLRPVADLRIGAFTMAGRWERLLTGRASYVTQDYLAEQFPLAVARDNYFINASLLPTPELVARIRELSQGEALTHADELLAARLDDRAIRRISQSIDEDAPVEGPGAAGGGAGEDIRGYDYEGEVTLLRRPYDLFKHNGAVIRADFETLTRARHGQPVPPSNTVFGGHAVFLEPDAVCEACILNTTDGPIYIGRGARVMEGSVLRGPLVVGEGAKVKVGAKLYGDTAVGPYCSVGGEVSNVVFQGYCNKGHDGYLGNAVVGRWCNLGADTNASNLKNNYAPVRVWDYETEGFRESGELFCGLIMGDHAKCGINTMFNTGTVVGTAANVFGAGYPRTFVPDFAWGGPAGMTTHRIDKAYETAERMMARRSVDLTEAERDVLEHVYALTARYRRWEKAPRAAAAAAPDNGA